MDDDYRDLANRLFATATAMLEDAIGTAVAGQSPRLDARRLGDAARRLQAAGREIGAIAEAAAIVASLGLPQQPKKHRRR